MVCSARARSELYQIDAKWMVIFRLRILQNTVCGLSIGAVAFTLGHISEFQPDGWKKTNDVLYYLPIVILTIIWNTVNIVWLVKSRRPLSTKANAGVHCVLALAFVILGCICTVNVVGARGKLFNDLYGLKADGPHDTAAANGTTVTVTPENVRSCPAFPNCDAQQHWLNSAYLRSGIAIGGCVLVDIAFFLHAGLSIWFILNAIHGVNPRLALPHNEELEKYQKDNSEWIHGGEMVAHSERALGSEPWMRSNNALLGPKPTFAIHDEESRSSIAVSVISTQNEALQSPQPAYESASPTIATSNHFGPSKGTPIEARDSFLSYSVPQLKRMDFPDPVKVDSSMRMSEYDLKFSPLSLPQRPYSGASTPNFSRPSSRGGDPQIPLPGQADFYRQVTHSQRSHAPSPVLSDHSESGRLPNGRPKTADLSMPEEELTALPPVPPFKDLRKSQIGWI